MIIEKDWTYKRRNVETKEITCEVFFRIVDDNRKVDIYTTAGLICEIKRWIKILSKTTPKRNKNGFLNNEPARLPINKWEHWLGYLIPENRALSEIDFTADFTKQHFVKLNYKLLEDGKLLSYNQALFLLLGLNAIELDDNIIDFPVLNGARPNNPIESYFWNTPQNQTLKQSAYFRSDGKITSKKLKELAKENNFFTTPKQLNQKTVQKDKNIEIVKNTLVNFLKQSKSKSKYNKNSLKQSAELINILKDNGLIVIETDMDASKKPIHRKSNEITPATLYDYLTEIFTSDWWTKQDKSIQIKVKNYQ